METKGRQPLEEVPRALSLALRIGVETTELPFLSPA